jgi:hypothetical protein
MENLFKLVNQKFYVGHYLPYNQVGETEGIFDDGESSFRLHRASPKQFFDGKHFVYTFEKSVNADEEEFKKNYGNPLCEVTLYRSTFVVEENDDKVSMKTFYIGKHRKVGEVFFRTSSKLNYITYNKKTKIITVGKNNEYLKKRGKGKSNVVRRNSFPVGLTTDSYYSFMNGTQDKEIYSDSIIKGINLFLNKIGADKINELSELPVSLFGCVLDNQGVKKPDNWRCFYDVFPKPTKKEYVKNGLKMIDTYMKIHNISSEKIKKVLHKVQNPCFTSIKNLISAFGRDFILQRPEEELCIVFNSKGNETPFAPIVSNLNNFKKRDLHNCYQIYLFIKKNVDFVSHTFYDHISFFNTISRYEPVRWNSKTLKEFNAEHVLWSDKVDFYTKGKYSRQYSEDFVSYVSRPITTKNNGVFTPVVLQTSEQYVDESINQSNCVRTYQDKAYSLIISLRKENGDRASIEFIPILGKFGMNENQPVHFKRVQTLGRFNYSLDETWHDAIFNLEVRLKTVTLKMWGKPSAQYITGYKSQERGLTFDDNGKLCWDNLHKSDDMDYLAFYDEPEF